MNAEQLLNYAEENWFIKDLGGSNYRVTVTWSDDSEISGLLSFAVEGHVMIGCPIGDAVLAGSELIQNLVSEGAFFLIPSPDGVGNYLAKIAGIESLDFRRFDEMYDSVFDTVDAAQSGD